MTLPRSRRSVLRRDAHDVVEAWAALNKYVEDGTGARIRTLSLYQLRVTAKQFAWLASVVRHLLRNLQVMDLSSVGMDDTACLALCRSLESGGVRLTSLKLCGNELAHGAAAAIGHYLTSLPGSELAAVHLRYNQLGIQGAATLLKKLSHHPVLHTLDVGSNGIVGGGDGARGSTIRYAGGGSFWDAQGDAHARAWVDAAGVLSASASKLKTLMLYGNDLGDDGVAGLSAYLHNRHACRLTVLDLWGCGVGPDGAGVVAEFLRRSVTVREVRLGNNHLSDAGAKKIAAAAVATRAPQFATLDLSGNLIGDASAAALQRMARGDGGAAKLRHLNLRDNQLTLEPCLSLATAAAASQHLQMLNVSRNHLTLTDCDILYVSCCGDSGRADAPCVVQFAPFESEEQYTTATYTPSNPISELLNILDGGVAHGGTTAPVAAETERPIDTTHSPGHHPHHLLHHYSGRSDRDRDHDPSTHHDVSGSYAHPPGVHGGGIGVSRDLSFGSAPGSSMHARDLDMPAAPPPVGHRDGEIEGVRDLGVGVLGAGYVGDGDAYARTHHDHIADDRVAGVRGVLPERGRGGYSSGLGGARAPVVHGSSGLPLPAVQRDGPGEGYYGAPPPRAWVDAGGDGASPVSTQPPSPHGVVGVGAGDGAAASYERKPLRNAAGAPRELLVNLVPQDARRVRDDPPPPREVDAALAFVAAAARGEDGRDTTAAVASPLATPTKGGAAGTPAHPHPHRSPGGLSDVVVSPLTPATGQGAAGGGGYPREPHAYTASPARGSGAPVAGASPAADDWVVVNRISLQDLLRETLNVMPTAAPAPRGATGTALERLAAAVESPVREGTWRDNHSHTHNHNHNHSTLTVAQTLATTDPHPPIDILPILDQQTQAIGDGPVAFYPPNVDVVQMRDLVTHGEDGGLVAGSSERGDPSGGAWPTFANTSDIDIALMEAMGGEEEAAAAAATAGCEPTMQMQMQVPHHPTHDPGTPARGDGAAELDGSAGGMTARMSVSGSPVYPPQVAPHSGPHAQHGTPRESPTHVPDACAAVAGFVGGGGGAVGVGRVAARQEQQQLHDTNEKELVHVGDGDDELVMHLDERGSGSVYSGGGGEIAVAVATTPTLAHAAPPPSPPPPAKVEMRDASTMVDADEVLLELESSTHREDISATLRGASRVDIPQPQPQQQQQASSPVILVPHRSTLVQALQQHNGGTRAVPASPCTPGADEAFTETTLAGGGDATTFVSPVSTVDPGIAARAPPQAARPTADAAEAGMSAATTPVRPTAIGGAHAAGAAAAALGSPLDPPYTPYACDVALGSTTGVTMTATAMDVTLAASTPGDIAPCAPPPTTTTTGGGVPPAVSAAGMDTRAAAGKEEGAQRGGGGPPMDIEEQEGAGGVGDVAPPPPPQRAAAPAAALDDLDDSRIDPIAGLSDSAVDVDGSGFMSPAAIAAIHSMPCPTTPVPAGAADGRAPGTSPRDQHLSPAQEFAVKLAEEVADLTLTVSPGPAAAAQPQHASSSPRVESTTPAAATPRAGSASGGSAVGLLTQLAQGGRSPPPPTGPTTPGPAAAAAAVAEDNSLETSPFNEATSPPLHPLSQAEPRAMSPSATGAAHHHHTRTPSPRGSPGASPRLGLLSQLSPLTATPLHPGRGVGGGEGGVMGAPGTGMVPPPAVHLFGGAAPATDAQTPPGGRACAVSLASSSGSGNAAAAAAPGLLATLSDSRRASPSPPSAAHVAASPHIPHGRSPSHARSHGTAGAGPDDHSLASPDVSPAVDADAGDAVVIPEYEHTPGRVDDCAAFSDPEGGASTRSEESSAAGRLDSSDGVDDDDDALVRAASADTTPERDAGAARRALRSCSVASSVSTAAAGVVAAASDAGSDASPAVACLAAIDDALGAMAGGGAAHPLAAVGLREEDGDGDGDGDMTPAMVVSRARTATPEAIESVDDDAQGPPPVPGGDSDVGDGDGGACSDANADAKEDASSNAAPLVDVLPPAAKPPKEEEGALSSVDAASRTRSASVLTASEGGVAGGHDHPDAAGGGVGDAAPAGDVVNPLVLGAAHDRAEEDGAAVAPAMSQPSSAEAPESECVVPASDNAARADAGAPPSVVGADVSPRARSSDVDAMGGRAGDGSPATSTDAPPDTATAGGEVAAIVNAAAAAAAAAMAAAAGHAPSVGSEDESARCSSAASPSPSITCPVLPSAAAGWAAFAKGDLRKPLNVTVSVKGAPRVRPSVEWTMTHVPPPPSPSAHSTITVVSRTPGVGRTPGGGEAAASPPRTPLPGATVGDDRTDAAGALPPCALPAAPEGALRTLTLTQRRTTTVNVKGLPRRRAGGPQSVWRAPLPFAGAGGADAAAPDAAPPAGLVSAVAQGMQQVRVVKERVGGADGDAAGSAHPAEAAAEAADEAAATAAAATAAATAAAGPFGASPLKEALEARKKDMDTRLLQEATIYLRTQSFPLDKKSRVKIVKSGYLKPDGPSNVRVVVERGRFVVVKHKKRIRSSKLLHCIPALFTLAAQTLVKHEGPDLFMWDVRLSRSNTPEAGWICVQMESPAAAAAAAERLVQALQGIVAGREAAVKVELLEAFKAQQLQQQQQPAPAASASTDAPPADAASS